MLIKNNFFIWILYVACNKIDTWNVIQYFIKVKLYPTYYDHIIIISINYDMIIRHMYEMIGTI